MSIGTLILLVMLLIIAYISTAVASYFAGKKISFETGYNVGLITGKWERPGPPRIDTFDKKVDIVCNACGLVGEFECAACNPVMEE